MPLKSTECRLYCIEHTLFIVQAHTVHERRTFTLCTAHMPIMYVCPLLYVHFFPSSSVRISFSFCLYFLLLFFSICSTHKCIHIHTFCRLFFTSLWYWLFALGCQRRERMFVVAVVVLVGARCNGKTCWTKSSKKFPLSFSFFDRGMHHACEAVAVFFSMCLRTF